MAKKDILTAKTRSSLAAFCKRHEIHSVRIASGFGLTKNTRISDITLVFIGDSKNKGSEYSVQFKLQKDCVDIYQYVEAINTEPEFAVQLTRETDSMPPERVNAKLQTFISMIGERVKSVQKEQQVQNICFVGNTFVLNNATKFKVISDDGAGRLNIEVLTQDSPLDALLTASGLLDGLYLGSIKLVDP